MTYSTWQRRDAVILTELFHSVRQEPWGNRSLIEAWFGLFKYRTRRFWHRFPDGSSADSTRLRLRAFATLHNAAR